MVVPSVLCAAARIHPSIPQYLIAFTARDWQTRVDVVLLCKRNSLPTYNKQRLLIGSAHVTCAYLILSRCMAVEHATETPSGRSGNCAVISVRSRHSLLNIRKAAVTSRCQGSATHCHFPLSVHVTLLLHYRREERESRLRHELS